MFHFQGHLRQTMCMYVYLRRLPKKISYIGQELYVIIVVYKMGIYVALVVVVVETLFQEGSTQ